MTLKFHPSIFYIKSIKFQKNNAIILKQISQSNLNFCMFHHFKVENVYDDNDTVESFFIKMNKLQNIKYFKYFGLSPWTYYY